MNAVPAAEPVPAPWRRHMPHRLGWCVLTAALAALTMLLLRNPDTAPTPLVPASTSGADDSEPDSASWWRADSAPVARREPVRAALAGDEIEICGGARVKVDARGEPEDAQMLTFAMTHEARQRTLAAMSSSSDALTRAAALFLAPAWRELAPASRDTLARTAASTADPRLYALAMHACGASAAAQDGACQMLSAAQWARLDPANAVPWMFVADAASSGGDAGALNEAMYRIAQASRSDAGERLVSALVLAHVPTADASLPGSVHLMHEVIDTLSAWSVPRYTVTRFCDDTQLHDPNGRQTCADMAEVLAMKSTHMLDQRQGADIGRRLGWAEERNASFNAERDAIGVGVASSLRVGGSTLGCEWARRNLAYLHEVAAYGPLGAGRRVVQRPSLPQTAPR